MKWDTNDPRWTDYRTLWGKLDAHVLQALVGTGALTAELAQALSVRLALEMNEHLKADNPPSPPTRPIGRVSAKRREPPASSSETEG